MKRSIAFLLITHFILFALPLSAQTPELTGVVNIIVKTIPGTGQYGAWFGWQGSQANKPKLEVSYRLNGSSYKKIYQHGLNGQTQPQSFYLKSGGGWEDKVGSTREGHKHNIHVKLNLLRNGFFKCDINDLPLDAVIEKATLWLHIHSEEGLKLNGGDGVLGFYECPRDWDWNEMDWYYYRSGKRWTSAGGDMGKLIVRKDRQKDIAYLGYHKSANQNWPLDLTAYVKEVHQERQATALEHGWKTAMPGIRANPNPFNSRTIISISGFKFQVSSFKLALYDIKGQQLETWNLKHGTFNKISWNASNHPAGVYYLKAITGGKVYTRRLILMK
jgi:hypothetical protein